MKQLTFSVLILLMTYTCLAQDGNIAIGYAQTSFEKNAVNFAVDYAKALEPKLASFKGGKRSLLSFSPELKILLGSNDVFNGITAKYVGNIQRFKLTTISGVDSVPDLSKSFTNFPVSIGVETNRDFSFVNGLIEAGYVPWYQNNKNVNKYVRQSKFGVFLQAGYKFDLSDSSVKRTGGAMDQSAEKPNENILRVKSVFGISPKFYFDKDEEFGLSIIATGTVWYDFLNSEIYYNLEGKFRFMLKKDYYFDLGYEKGSGAPNFNQGEQFTANLGVRF